MTISQLARAASVRPDTVRYYQRLGLLRIPQRQDHTFRSYGDEDVAQLQFIRRAKALGFTLDDIAALLRLSKADCDNIERLASERLESVKLKIVDLRNLEVALETAVAACVAREPYSGCPLIEALLGDS